MGMLGRGIATEGGWFGKNSVASRAGNYLRNNQRANIATLTRNQKNVLGNEKLDTRSNGQKFSDTWAQNKMSVRNDNQSRETEIKGTYDPSFNQEIKAKQKPDSSEEYDSTPNDKSSARREKSAMEKQIEAKREAQERALEAMIKAGRADAKGAYDSGIAQIDNLIKLLEGSQSAAKGRLDTQFNRGKELYDDQRAQDINQMLSGYASRGIGDSEQALQAQERLRGEYAKRFAGLESDYNAGLVDLENANAERMTGYGNKKIALKENYDSNLRDLDSNVAKTRAGYEESIAGLLKDLQDYNLKERQLDISQQRIGGSKGGSKGNQSFTQRAYELRDELGGAWDKVADQLWSEGYNLMPGSEESKVLDYIMTGKAPSAITSDNLANATDEELYNMIYGIND